ncbi:MAG: hypothetical protein WAX66_00380 [Patescibacteria group bacterium]
MNNSEKLPISRNLYNFDSFPTGKNTEVIKEDARADYEKFSRRFEDFKEGKEKPLPWANISTCTDKLLRISRCGFENKDLFSYTLSNEITSFDRINNRPIYNTVVKEEAERIKDNPLYAWDIYERCKNNLTSAIEKVQEKGNEEINIIEKIFNIKLSSSQKEIKILVLDNSSFFDILKHHGVTNPIESNIAAVTILNKEEQPSTIVLEYNNEGIINKKTNVIENQINVKSGGFLIHEIMHAITKGRSIRTLDEMGKEKEYLAHGFGIKEETGKDTGLYINVVPKNIDEASATLLTEIAIPFLKNSEPINYQEVGSKTSGIVRNIANTLESKSSVASIMTAYNTETAELAKVVDALGLDNFLEYYLNSNLLGFLEHLDSELSKYDSTWFYRFLNKMQLTEWYSAKENLKTKQTH